MTTPNKCDESKLHVFGPIITERYDANGYRKTATILYKQYEELKRKADAADEMAFFLKELLDGEEADRASGDSGFWEWEEDSTYNKSRAILKRYKQQE